MRRDKKWADLCVALVVGLHLVAVQVSKQLRLRDLLEVVRHICAEYNGQDHLVMVLIWLCFGYVLVMFWLCFGYVLVMFWL
jgi:hypothetical protein